MSPFVRRAVIGTIAGTIAAAPLISALGHIVGVLLLGALIGAGFAIMTGPTPGAYLDSIFTAGAYGVPLWAVITVITLPLLSGQMPEWSAEQMRSHFPALVGWVLFGVTLGFCTQLLNDITTRWLGPEAAPQGQDPTPTKRIVILGGGFAGMKTAECLERELEKDRSVSISLVSETNALLFTPMLAEVAGSSLEPSHISTPLRTSLHRTEFVRGRVTGVDLESKRVSLDAGNGAETCQSELTYDHLVFALGAVSNYLGLSNVHLEDAAITPWLVTAMVTPALGVLMLMAFSKAARENILWKINWRALAFAPFCILIPTLVAFAEIAIFSGKGWGRSAWFAFSTAGVQVSGGRWLLGRGEQDWPLFITNIVLTATVYSLVGMVFGAGEELGWRGYLQGQLIQRFGLSKGIICLGLLWSFWHLPLLLAGYNYPENPVLGALLLSPILLVAASFLLAWLTLRTRSFWPAALVHGAGDSI